MKTKLRQKNRFGKHGTGSSRWMKEWQRRRERIQQRLDKENCEPEDGEQPVMQGSNVQCEISERLTGTAYGGMAVMHQFVRQLGLAELIDERLQLLAIHKPYHESDHVLNFAYNALCDGDCLEDMELRRMDEGYLNGLGARRTPDPTTAGDFCRRFETHHVRVLLDVFNETRLKVWKRQPSAFFAEAVIDMDGTLVETGAEKMEAHGLSR